MHLSRRQFLNRSLGSSAVLAFDCVAPEFLARAALEPDASSGQRDRASVLVVVQLTGGNDGLNTLVPFEQEAYYRARPTLGLPENQLHKINDTLGFHPDLAPFQRLYQEGHLTIIQGVGYPKSSRDHDAAMRDWQTAAPGETVRQTGWIGRAIDHVATASPADLPGAFVGSIPTPFTLQAQTSVVPSFHTLPSWTPGPPPRSIEGQSHLRHLVELAEATRPESNPPLLPFLQKATIDACATAQRVTSVLDAENRIRANNYPPFQLAQTLCTVAQCIRANLGIRLYHVELGGGGIGGFDTHANQAANHGALLRHLAESVVAFIHDLQRDNLLDQVLLMTFSEFGRTVEENGRRGTDHGAAAPLFLAGAACKHRLVGPHPSLTELDGGGLKFHTDYRQVYATVLEGWLGFDSRSILGRPFETLDLF